MGSSTEGFPFAPCFVAPRRRLGGNSGAGGHDLMDEFPFTLNDGELTVQPMSDVLLDSGIRIKHDCEIGRWEGFSPTDAHFQYEKYAFDDEHLILANNFPYIECLDRQTGNSLWIYQFRQPGDDRRPKGWDKIPIRNFRVVSEASLLGDPKFRRKNMGSGLWATNLHRDPVTYRWYGLRLGFTWLMRIAGAALILAVMTMAYRKFREQPDFSDEDLF